MNNILKVLGIIFVCLIAALITSSINSYFGGNYLEFFIKEQLLVTMITLLGFNAASITFLISHILQIEKGNQFKNSKNEIFHNFVAMLIILFISFIFLCGLNFSDESTNEVLNIWVMIIPLTFLFFFCYLFYEVLHSIIFISKEE